MYGPVFFVSASSRAFIYFSTLICYDIFVAFFTSRKFQKESKVIYFTLKLFSFA